MLSVRIFIVLLLTSMLQGCSFAVSDILSSSSESMAEAPVEVELIKTTYKFEGRLKSEPLKKAPAIVSSTSGWRVVKH